MNPNDYQAIVAQQTNQFLSHWVPLVLLVVMLLWVVVRVLPVYLADTAADRREEVAIEAKLYASSPEGIARKKAEAEYDAQWAVELPPLEDTTEAVNGRLDN